MKRIVLLSVIFLFPFVMIAQTAEEYYLKGKNYYEGTNGVSKDYAEAYKWFSKAAEMGNANAMNGLGVIYEFGHGVTKDYNEALKWFRKAVESGSVKAIHNLGSMYEYGRGVTKDYDEALHLFRKAAELNYDRSQNSIGYMYEKGYGVTKDDAEAFLWYLKAAKQGYSVAQTNVAIMYANGQGVSKDYAEAAKWYLKAAEQGNATAQHNLGNFYRDGKGVTKDYKEAFNWYLKSAEQGNAQAQNNIGTLYRDGKGVTKDYKEAFNWYLKSAEQNNITGLTNLGYMYEYGYGINKDYSEALKWYRKAAEQNNAWAQNKMGDMYYYGYGVTKDYAEAAKWYRKAAEQGNKLGQVNLGHLFEVGLGISKDYYQAIKWYRKAAEQGDDMAQNNLGVMYKYGKGVNIDYTEAFKWYSKAAEKGNARAQNALGYMYENGEGVTQNYNTALQWYKKSAEQNYAIAQNNVGVFYYNGHGVQKDYKEAIKWFEKAIKTDATYTYAMKNLGLVYELGNGVSNDYETAEKWYKKAIEIDPDFDEVKKLLVRVKVKKSKQSGDNLTKIVVPEQTTSMTVAELPIIDYVDNSLSFINPTGAKVIKSNGNYIIRFQLKNSGSGEGKNCKVKVSVSGNSEGITIHDMTINTIKSGETMTIDVPVKSGANISNGEVEFAIQVDEPNGMGFDPQYLIVDTKGFEAPWIKITDYSLSDNSKTVLKKKEPFELQLMLQNTEMGQADDVTVNMELPENVLLIDGTKDKRFDKLTGGEAKSLLYTLIVSNNYSKDIIPIIIHLKEKYGKYAEDRTISLTIDQTITSTKLSVREYQQQVRKELSIAKIVSDVDKDIPQTENRQENTFALIIANENYEDVDGVPYAFNDGTMFEKYCREALGIPQDHIHYLSDATLGKMRREVLWLQSVMKAFKEDASIILYYAGHGIPDEQSKTAYILPTDGTGRDIKTGLALSELYQSLESLPSKSVTIFLDACFSGTKREGNMITSARGVAIKVKPNTPKGNLVVFSAAQSDETAYPYEDQQHGLFTYFLLKKLKETGGNLTLGELADYVTQQVMRVSVLKNSKPQTPTVNTSSAFANSWKNLRMK